MEDVSNAIAGLLNSPDAVEKLKAMAGSLLASSGQTEGAAPARSAGDDLSAGDIAGMMRVMHLLKSGEDDSRAALLRSLRPHLSARRQQRVDEAIRLLRLMSILPAVKEAGLL